MSRLRIVEVLIATVAIVLGLVLLYYFVSSDILVSYGVKSRSWAVSGALALVGGGCIWLLARGRDILVNKLAGTIYVVSTGGREETFRRRSLAEERVRELRTVAGQTSEIKLTRIVTTIGDDGGRSTRTEDLPVNGT